MQRLVDEKEKSNIKEKSRFTEFTANEEQRHQIEISEFNRILNDQAIKLNGQYEELRKAKDSEIGQLHREIEEMRSAYDLRVN
jgi:hypothetical protein